MCVFSQFSTNPHYQNSTFGPHISTLGTYHSITDSTLGSSQTLHWVHHRLHTGFITDSTLGSSQTPSQTPHWVYHRLHTGFITDSTLGSSQTPHWVHHRLYTGFITDSTLGSSQTPHWVHYRLYTGYLPSNNDLIMVDALVQLQHLLVKVHVHCNLDRR
jgi:hypothetical protein